jgi:hypothetical protein
MAGVFSRRGAGHDEPDERAAVSLRNMRAVVVRCRCGNGAERRGTLRAGGKLNGYNVNHRNNRRDIGAPVSARVTRTQITTVGASPSLL